MLPIEKTPINTRIPPDAGRIDPVLYPVVSLVTGTTPNGGGVWKHILHGHREGLLRTKRPVLMQALHFLDFGLSPKALKKWRTLSLREHYNVAHDLNYEGHIFADSGGFTLMFDPELNLGRYDMPSDDLARSILRLQTDFGATRVASLDYPIPPGLDPEEAKRRQDLTLAAALATAEALAQMDASSRPQFHIPIHGLTPDGLRDFIDQLHTALGKRQLLHTVDGLALGSMVPRRKHGRVEEVMAFTRAAVETAGNLPVHVFGVTGSLMPHLVQAGVASFDSSTYIQTARVLKYIDPKTRRGLPWKHLPAYPCRCRFCAGRDIEADHAVMEGRVPGSKSAIYAAIALHNLEMDDQLLAEVKEAQSSGSLGRLIEQLPERYPAMRAPRTGVTPPAKPLVRVHNRKDYDVRMKRWRPTPGARVMLLLPCSQEKPYTASNSFRRVQNHLRTALGEAHLAQVDIVFISGLYGPVPQQHVSEPAVLTYDFLLHRANSAGICIVADRLTDFLKTHGAKYQGVVAYVNQLAYRKVLQRASHHHPLTLRPQGRMGQAAFYKRENLDDLVEQLRPYLEHAEPEFVVAAAD